MSKPVNESSGVEKDIFDRMKAGKIIRLDEPEYGKVQEVVTRTLRLSSELNGSSTGVDQTRNLLSELIGQEIDPSTRVFAPFYTNFGRFIRLGKNVFINHACSFLDMGGITIESDRRSG